MALDTITVHHNEVTEITTDTTSTTRCAICRQMISVTDRGYAVGIHSVLKLERHKNEDKTAICIGSNTYPS